MSDLSTYFPFIEQNNYIYLDSAATSQALYTVIEDQQQFEMHHRANAHRSGHKLGTWVDEKYHRAKELIGQWLDISNPHDRIVFTSGSTQALNDAVNMLANRFGRATIYIGMDFHHSLFLPFQKLANGSSFFNIKVININNKGDLDLVQLEKELEKDTGPKILAFSAVSNVIGRVADLEEIKRIANKHAMTTVVDASQYVSKRNGGLNDFDFVAWSWHKVYGPMGLGCLVIGDKWTNEEPTRPGGGSIIGVTLRNATWQTNAGRFESGTQNLSAICTLPRLIEWLISHREDIEEHDVRLANYVNWQLSPEMFKPVAEPQTSLISLSASTGATEDYGYMLDANNILVRTGKLCAEPLLAKLGVTGLLRLSWAAYTSHRDVEQAFDIMGQIHGRLSKHI